MTASALDIADREAEWIVCLGETRVAVGSVVSCPRRDDAAVSIDECWECHLLAWRSNERDLAALCTTMAEDTIG